MFYAVLGYAHAALWRLNLAVTRRVKAIHALAGERGQGTVEYVGLILLVSLLMVGMVAAMKGFNSYLSKGGHYRSVRMVGADGQLKERTSKMSVQHSSRLSWEGLS
jgi:hypothetical protein